MCTALNRGSLFCTDPVKRPLLRRVWQMGRTSRSRYRPVRRRSVRWHRPLVRPPDSRGCVASRLSILRRGVKRSCRRRQPGGCRRLRGGEWWFSVRTCLVGWMLRVGVSTWWLEGMDPCWTRSSPVVQFPEKTQSVSNRVGQVLICGGSSRSQVSAFLAIGPELPKFDLYIKHFEINLKLYTVVVRRW